MQPLRLSLFAACVAAALSLSAAERESVPLLTGWRFQQAEPAGAELPGFDDSGWQSVALPHNWGWMQAQRGENYFRGTGWYRRELNVGKPKSQRRYFLRFEAAGSVADVYLNGKWLGQHRGAFGAFCFEITSQLSATGTNLLAVRASNAPEPD